MCGIVGIAGVKDAAPVILEALRQVSRLWWAAR